MVARADQGAELVASVLGLDVGELMGRGRTARVAAARRVLYRWLTLAGYSSTEAGRVVGRDHTSVLAGLRCCSCGAATRPTADAEQACRVCGVRYWAPVPRQRAAVLLALATGESRVVSS